MYHNHHLGWLLARVHGLSLEEGGLRGGHRGRNLGRLVSFI